MPEGSKESRRSVAQVNRMIRGIVEAETVGHFFWARGKVERYYKSDMGHVYFELADGKTRIRCALKKHRTIPFDLHNDMEVDVYGDVRVYEERASVEIRVLNVRLIASAADASPTDAAEEVKQPAQHPFASNGYLRLLDIIHLCSHCGVYCAGGGDHRLQFNGVMMAITASHAAAAVQRA